MQSCIIMHSHTVLYECFTCLYRYVWMNTVLCDILCYIDFNNALMYHNAFIYRIVWMFHIVQYIYASYCRHVHTIRYRHTHKMYTYMNMCIRCIHTWICNIICHIVPYSFTHTGTDTFIHTHSCAVFIHTYEYGTWMMYTSYAHIHVICA